MLAVTASVSPAGVVSFTGNSQADSLEIFADSGILRYTGASPAATTLNVALSSITALNIDLGGGSDSVTFRGMPLSFSQGSLSVQNTETTNLRTSIATAGDLQYLSGAIVVDGEIVLSAGEDIIFAATINSAATAASATVDGNLFLAWQRSLGETSGASMAQGDLDGDGDVDGADLAPWRTNFGSQFERGSRLSVNASGAVEFAAQVGAVQPLLSLSVDASAIRLNSVAEDAVRTFGAQTYSGPVRLMRDATVSSTSGDVTFGGTVDGAVIEAQTLNVIAGRTVTFDGQVGGNTALDRLTTAGVTKLDIASAGIDILAGSQVFDDAVILAQDTVLEATSAGVTFINSVDGTTTGGQSLDVRGATKTFGGAVGATVPLKSLMTSPSGFTRLDPGSLGVSTVGDQIYGDFVEIWDGARLTGRNVAFLSRVNRGEFGSGDLTIEAQGVSFLGSVGATAPLRDLIVHARSDMSLTTQISVTRDVVIEVRERPTASPAESLTLSGAQLDAGRHVQLRAGDDLTIASGVVVDADGQLSLEVDFGDNDPAGATLTTTTSAPNITDATGMLRGGAGIVFRGGAAADAINVQMSRLSTPGQVRIEGFAVDPGVSGADEFLLVFQADFVSSVGSVMIDGGYEAGSDRLVLEHSKDTLSRKVRVQYTTDYATADAGNVVDGANAQISGYAPGMFVVAGVEKYWLKAGSGAHDHLAILARDQIIPATPGQDYLQHELHIRVSSDASGQWQVQGFESGQLVGSNVRDVIDNNTNIPMLLEGRAGNDTIVGGSSLDVIFSGAGVSRTPGGAAIMFNLGAADVLLAPDFVRGGDAIVGAGGNDFLFADVELFRDGSMLWGMVTPDVEGEFDLLNGAGRGTNLAQTNHGAQLGNDAVFALNGTFIEDGSSDALVEAAFFASDVASNKVGLLSPPYNALYNDFEIAPLSRPLASAGPILPVGLPVLLARDVDHKPATTGIAKRRTAVENAMGASEAGDAEEPRATLNGAFELPEAVC